MQSVAVKADVKAEVKANEVSKVEVQQRAESPKPATLKADDCNNPGEASAKTTAQSSVSSTPVQPAASP